MKILPLLCNAAVFPYYTNLEIDVCVCLNYLECHLS